MSQKDKRNRGRNQIYHEPQTSREAAPVSGGATGIVGHTKSAIWRSWGRWHRSPSKPEDCACMPTTKNTKQPSLTTWSRYRETLAFDLQRKVGSVSGVPRTCIRTITIPRFHNAARPDDRAHCPARRDLGRAPPLSPDSAACWAWNVPNRDLLRLAGAPPLGSRPHDCNCWVVWLGCG